jgi:hypothetical protein
MTRREDHPEDVNFEHELDFWQWLWPTGLRTLADRWLALHVVVGGAVAAAVDKPLSGIALTVFLPFASVLVGLAFAWGGNAMAVLQSDELHTIGSQPGAPNGYRDWVFAYQLAILVILVVLVVWTLAALGVSDVLARIFPRRGLPIHTSGRVAAFALSSIAVRESWNVVLGAQGQLIAKHRLRIEREAARKQCPTCGR